MRVRREPAIIELHPPIDSKDPRKTAHRKRERVPAFFPAKLLRYQKDPPEYAEDPWLSGEPPDEKASERLYFTDQTAFLTFRAFVWVNIACIDEL
ncbi:hypothetical protein CEXT_130711 [Caerostris extrusa]|uniref:Uncharacterized protein n=1 Tax=Caerostris extrusa TaxID=172846 RepID=A0AAV4VHP9_CAEEX|nr:hypothetical protein CEXT_130711 [Caerostris extrusa]